MAYAGYQDWLEIKKGTPISLMEATNQIPPVMDSVTTPTSVQEHAMSETERQHLLLDKLDLSGLDACTPEMACNANSLLWEYDDIFSVEQTEIGHTKAAQHKMVLKDPELVPLRERFRRIPPPQVEEVHEHLKVMLDAVDSRPSNSPWCNAVVLVRKKDGALHFCIDFRRLNALTRKDSHSLLRIVETLDSLVGSAYYSTCDLTWMTIPNNIPRSR